MFLVLTSNKLREAADAIEGFEDDKNQALEEIAPELAQQQNEDAVKSAWLRNTKLDDETAISKLFAKEVRTSARRPGADIFNRGPL